MSAHATTDNDTNMVDKKFNDKYKIKPQKKGQQVRRENEYERK